MNYAAIRRDLLRLCKSRKKINIPGAEWHQFRRRRRLSEEQVARLEAAEGITFPPDYRGFLREVGDGVAGPHQGIFRFGWLDFVTMDEPWIRFRSHLVGDMSAPFPFTEPWNDLSGRPEPDQADQEAYQRQLDEFERRYWAEIDGAVPICAVGQGKRIWLVLTGPERGWLWRDDRAACGGFYPVTQGDSERVSFGAWYQAWLDETVELIR